MKPLVVFVIIVIAIGAGLYASSDYRLNGGEAGAPDDATASGERVAYLPLAPPFLVNFEMQGKLRFLQVSVEVMSSEPSVIEAVQTHMPRLRNNVLMLLSDQTADTLVGREAKQKLRTQILAELRKDLLELTGDPGVEAVYFTNFVMQ